MVLLIFGALCTCLTVEDTLCKKKDRGRKQHGSCVSTTYRFKSIIYTYGIYF